MNERNLSRSLSTSIVDALKSQGHILVVKGGATALARELEELMAPSLVTITLRITPFSVIGGEVTSTFGSEAADEAVEELVLELTSALMDSDHVEDVFAEDNVIRRDIFRVLREGLLRPPEGAISADEEQVKIKLDTLGYVAGTVSKLCDPKTLREALGRAADQVQAHFNAYEAEAREATFTLEDGDPDGRLSLEEAIADELTDLVEHGEIELPTIDRTIELSRALTGPEQRALSGRIDTIAKQTLLRTGCAASWDYAGSRAILVTFTPLSDQDAGEVDDLVGAFGRELIASLHDGPAKPAAVKPARAAKAAPSAPAKGKAAKSAVMVETEEDDDLDDDDDDDLDDEDDDDDDLEDEDLDDDEDDDDDDDEELDEDDEDEPAAEEAPAAEASRRAPVRAKEPRATKARAPAPKRAAAKRTTTPEPEKRARATAKAAPRKAKTAKRAAPAPAKVRKTPAKKR